MYKIGITWEKNTVKFYLSKSTAIFQVNYY